MWFGILKTSLVYLYTCIELTVTVIKSATEVPTQISSPASKIIFFIAEKYCFTCGQLNCLQ